MGLLIKLVLILFASNAVVFLWPDRINEAPHLYLKQSEQNPHFVRLNKEIEERFYSEADGQSELGLSPSEDASEPSAILLALNEIGDGVCYRLGPFMHKESYDLAQAVLFNADVEYQKTVRSSQKSNVYRLYLGPYDTSSEVAKVRQELNSKLILDHFSRKLSEGEYMVSLGIYSTQDAADSALRLFQRKLNDIKMRNETILLPDSYWLHFLVDESSAKFSYLRDIDWGENSVKLGPYSCNPE